MIDIDKRQYDLLTKLMKQKEYSVKQHSSEELEMCEYLEHEGLVTTELTSRTVKTSLGKLPSWEIKSYKITEKGRAHRYSFFEKLLRWWIPLIISFISLGVSIASLFL